MQDKFQFRVPAALCCAGLVISQSQAISAGNVSLPQSIEVYSDSVAPPAGTAPSEAGQENVDSILSLFKELDEVTVSVRRNTIRTDGANVTYDMSADDTSKGKSLLDALRSVPMVTVDGQDNIAIKGDSNFKIYVNGKEDSMLESNYQRVFKAMPAASVKKIEVLTDPGAAYDAEGSGGILNIVTETEQRNDGYAGTLTASLGNMQWMAGASGRMKKSKFSADAGAYYAANSFGDIMNRQSERRTAFNDAVNHIQQSEGEYRTQFKFVNVSVNTSWEPDRHDLFTFGGSFMSTYGSMNSVGNGMEAMMLDAADNPVWIYRQDTRARVTYGSAKANASYQRSFDDAGHRLVVAYMFDFGRSPIKLDYTQEDVQDYTSAIPFSRLDSRTFKRKHTAQADYSNPFGGDRHKLTAGIKLMFRRDSSLSATYVGNSGTDIPDTPVENVDMAQTQDIYAAYAQYTGHFGKITGIAGIRYEHTFIKNEYRDKSAPGYESRLNDAVPNVSLSYSVYPATAWRLAYSMRISRPGIDRLNPYEIRLGNKVRKGNPDLTSQRTDNISLSFLKFGRTLGGNISAEYRHTGNAIEDFTYFERELTYTTYANVGKTDEAALSGYINAQLSNVLSFNVSVRAAHKWMSSRSPRYSNKGWTGNLNASASYTAPGKVKLSLFGGGKIHDIQLQGHTSGWYYYGLGIGRSFLKDDALTLTLNANNFAQKYITYKSYIRTTDNESISAIRNRTWNVGLSVQWNFGRLNSHTRKADLEIDNDDELKSTSVPGRSSGGIL